MKNTLLDRVMIAWAGVERYEKGYFDDCNDDFEVRPVWSLEDLNNAETSKDVTLT
jgi:tRNA A37 threonylcarbamoyltransferase TsaD